ncbi:MAG TPA: sigma-70 family RNA polymerase sigma factor [Acidimicrobiia bacterium]|nr:sigma-70 family RNA polymerase sigma factor [Acidimicrobiia bacterium]
MTYAETIGDGYLALEAELERHRVALTGYCYRMLGSVFEADDAVQETMLRAWRALGRYEGRASVRSWLFRIATNVCIDLLNGRRRRALPMDLGPASPGDREVAGPAHDIPWMTPVPDGRVIDPTGDPAEQAVARDSIRLAFVAALQHLGPRPRAVLILRDVLGWSANDVAAVLDTTATAVHSLLQRAHRTLAAAGAATDTGGAGSLSTADRALLARYVDAFVRYDVEALLAVIHEDATVSMPPNREWLWGRASIERWWRGPGSECRGSRVLPTSANGTPALGVYRPRPDGTFGAFAIQVVEMSTGLITGIHNFLEPDLFPLFGLPARLTSDGN